jgi:hypothetical protein
VFREPSPPTRRLHRGCIVSCWPDRVPQNHIQDSLIRPKRCQSALSLFVKVADLTLPGETSARTAGVPVGTWVPDRSLTATRLSELIGDLKYGRHRYRHGRTFQFDVSAHRRLIALLANLNSSRENEATKWYFHVWSRRSAAGKRRCCPLTKAERDAPSLRTSL